jgi:hypothetical protein
MVVCARQDRAGSQADLREADCSTSVLTDSVRSTAAPQFYWLFRCVSRRRPRRGDGESGGGWAEQAVGSSAGLNPQRRGPYSL